MTTQDREVVGFIGLGVMGTGMATNIASSGWDVVGYDPAPRDSAVLDAAGVRLAGSPREVAAAATGVVISMVRTAEQTHAVLLGPDGVAAADRDRLTAVVMSTLDPETMRGLADELAARRVTAIDATVSGGEWGARDGTLTIVAGGDADLVERLRPLYEAMGSNVFAVGGRAGTAQAAKLAVQLGFAISMLGAFEALQIASTEGVDETQLMEILSLSVGDSWVTRNWQRVRGWWEHYVPGEDLDILLKDLRAIMRHADGKVSLPVTALAFQRMRHVWDEATAADHLPPAP